jgi:hypothetical protein
MEGTSSFIVELILVCAFICFTWGQSCPSQRQTSAKFAVRVERNQTGHWITKVKGQTILRTRIRADCSARTPSTPALVFRTSYRMNIGKCLPGRKMAGAWTCISSWWQLRTIPYSYLHLTQPVTVDQSVMLLAYFLGGYLFRNVRRVRKMAKSDCQLVRPYVRVEQLGCHWTDFHAIWDLCSFRYSVEKIIVSLKFWRIKDALDEDQYTLLIIYCSIIVNK